MIKAWKKFPICRRSWYAWASIPTLTDKSAQFIWWPLDQICKSLLNSVLPLVVEWGGVIVQGNTLNWTPKSVWYVNVIKNVLKLYSNLVIWFFLFIYKGSHTRERWAAALLLVLRSILLQRLAISKLLERKSLILLKSFPILFSHFETCFNLS